MELASLLKWIDAYNLNAIRTNTAYLVDAAYAASRSDDASAQKMDGVLSQQEFSNELLARSLSVAIRHNTELHKISEVLANVSSSLDEAVQQMRGRNRREERAEALKELLYVMEKYQTRVFEDADWDEDELDDALNGLVSSDYEKKVRRCIADGPTATLNEVKTAIAKEFSRPMTIRALLEHCDRDPEIKFYEAMGAWIRKRLYIPTREAFELDANTILEPITPATPEAATDDDDPAGAPRREDYPVVSSESPEWLRDWILQHPDVPDARQWTPDELAAEQTRRLGISLRIDTATDLLREKGIALERSFGFRILLRTIESSNFTTKDLSSIDEKRYFDGQLSAARRAVQDAPAGIIEELDRLEQEYALYQEVSTADITVDLPEVRVKRSQNEESLRVAARAKHNSVFNNTDEEVEEAQKCVDEIVRVETRQKEAMLRGGGRGAPGFLTYEMETTKILDDHLIYIGSQFGHSADGIKYAVKRIVQVATEFRAQEAELIQRERAEVEDWNSKVDDYNLQRQARLEERKGKRDSLLADLRARLNAFLELHPAIQDFLPLVD